MANNSGDGNIYTALTFIAAVALLTGIAFVVIRAGQLGVPLFG